jgi:hypothetical protein
VPKFLRYTGLQTVGDRAVRLLPRLDLHRLGNYIDTEEAAKRLRRLQEGGLVPDASREAVALYLREFEML